MGAILGEQLLNAAKIMEEQVDQEIKDLEKLDEDDLEAIRRRKLGMTVDEFKKVLHTYNKLWSEDSNNRVYIFLIPFYIC